MKVYLTWDEFDNLVEELCDIIPQGVYEGIYPIQRGGMIPAVMMSHKLGLPIIDRLQSYYGKKFLIVDDIADTGATLQKMKAEVYKEAHIATIHCHAQSVVEPHYWVAEKSNKWIVYPWEQEDSKEMQDYLKEVV